MMLRSLCLQSRILPGNGATHCGQIFPSQLSSCKNPGVSLISSQGQVGAGLVPRRGAREDPIVPLSRAPDRRRRPDCATFPSTRSTLGVGSPAGEDTSLPLGRVPCAHPALVPAGRQHKGPAKAAARLSSPSRLAQARVPGRASIGREPQGAWSRTLPYPTATPPPQISACSPRPAAGTTRAPPLKRVARPFGSL
ncbi:calcium-regulated heat-stable protein 1 isoform X2 [Peromyscus eremicus]|uniref:calcium-regulated heat-stable protein 1 isoform X2 n=1 Tax=Peromyscus eremicus TaxID=42410 RepID=UPI0027DAB9A3|nr:calcium-regulated heat-stable protein 1 isoform X2 [Peromyscus eremicus]